MLSNIDRGKFKPPSDVAVTDDRFIIRAEIAATCSYHQVEIETGEFRLEYALSKPVDDTRVTANYQNGILELPFLPRKSVNLADES